MSGKEVNTSNGVFNEAAPTGELIIPQGMLDRQAKQAEALRVVQAVSSLAGSEIPILPAHNAASIPREPGVYLFPDYDDIGNPIVDTSFELNPKLLSGRVDSAHSVLAGELTSMTSSGEERTVTVAVKCALKRTPEERFRRAINELGIMDFLYRNGELGFKPIALAVAPDHTPMDGKLVMISRFDGTINTMDNLPWGRGIDDPSNVESAALAAEAVGRFNAILGHQHNDSKIKNVATSSSPISTGLIDFETTDKFDPTVPFEASTAAYVDFGLLIESLVDKGFFNHSRAQEVLGYLAESYLAPWVESDKAVFDAVFDTVMDKVTRVLEKKPKAPVNS